MAHYAKIDKNNIVTRVLVMDKRVVNSGMFGNPADWIQTSYNTHEGQHKLGGTSLRKNYAGIGYIYDKDKDAFIPPQPYPSWILNEDICQWSAPLPYPEKVGESPWNTYEDQNDPTYRWDEATTSWKESGDIPAKLKT